MKTIWLKGASTSEAKVEVRQSFNQATNMRGQLRKILDEKVEASRVAVRSTNTYDSPSWALLQADQIGYERALYEVISLIIDESVQER